MKEIFIKFIITNLFSPTDLTSHIEFTQFHHFQIAPEATMEKIKEISGKGGGGIPQILLEGGIGGAHSLYPIHLTNT